MEIFQNKQVRGIWNVIQDLVMTLKIIAEIPRINLPSFRFQKFILARVVKASRTTQLFQWNANSDSELELVKSWIQLFSPTNELLPLQLKH